MHAEKYGFVSTKDVTTGATNTILAGTKNDEQSKINAPKVPAPQTAPDVCSRADSNIRQLQVIQAYLADQLAQVTRDLENSTNCGK